MHCTVPIKQQTDNFITFCDLKNFPKVLISLQKLQKGMACFMDSLTLCVPALFVDYPSSDFFLHPCLGNVEGPLK